MTTDPDTRPVPPVFVNPTFSNDSRDVGYLTSKIDDPDYDEAFQRFVQALVVGCTGLPGDMVRLRWQKTPAVQPPLSTDWASVGVDEIAALNPYVLHHGRAANEDWKGHDDMAVQETCRVMLAFYGPHAERNAARCRDNLWIGQNGDAMFFAGVGFQKWGAMAAMHEPVNNEWLRHVEMILFLTREISRRYNVRNLIGVTGQIIAAVQKSSAVEPFDTSLVRTP